MSESARRPRTMRSLAVLIGAVGALGIAVPVGPGRVAHALGTLEIVSQRFNVGPDDRLEFVFARPTALDDIAMETMTLEVIAHEPIADRDDVTAAAAGDLPFTVDVVDLPTQRIAVLADGSLRVRIPIELEAGNEFAMQMSRAGVYPFSLTLSSDAGEIADVVTFVNRTPASKDDVGEALAFAMVTTTSADVDLDADGQPSVSPDDVNDLLDLVEALESSVVPMTVALRPTLLETVASTGATGEALVERLVTALADHDVLSMPYLPLDVSHAADAGADELYTRWLRAGEDTMLDGASVAPSRAAFLVTAPLSRPGADLVRDLGARVLVLTPTTYDDLPGSLQSYTDTSLMVGVGTVPRDGEDVAASVDAVVVDRKLGRDLAAPTSSPAATAVRMVAELLGLRTEILTSGDDVGRHGVTLGTPDLMPPSGELLLALTDLLSRTPGLRPTSLDELAVRTDRLRLGSEEVVVDLPDDSGGVLSERLDLMDELSLSARSAGSMLSADDQRQRWETLISLLPSSAVSDDLVGSIAEDLRREQEAVLRSVEMPTGFSFNLTARTGTVPITFHNPTDQPITIRVRLSSSKLVFPDGDAVVTLDPNAFTEIRVPLEARSNGTIPVTLEVLTPEGEVPLTAPIPLEAKVLALAALGNIVFTVVVLLVLVWWARHALRHRRRGEPDTLTA